MFLLQRSWEMWTLENEVLFAPLEPVRGFWCVSFWAPWTRARVFAAWKQRNPSTTTISPPSHQFPPRPLGNAREGEHRPTPPQSQPLTLSLSPPERPPKKTLLLLVLFFLLFFFGSLRALVLSLSHSLALWLSPQPRALLSHYRSQVGLFLPHPDPKSISPCPSTISLSPLSVSDEFRWISAERDKEEINTQYTHTNPRWEKKIFWYEEGRSSHTVTAGPGENFQKEQQPQHSEVGWSLSQHGIFHGKSRISSPKRSMTWFTF